MQAGGAAARACTLGMREQDEGRPRDSINGEVVWKSGALRGNDASGGYEKLHGT